LSGIELLALCPTPILEDQDLASGFYPLDGLASPHLYRPISPLVFFQGFPSVSLWDFLPSPTRQQCQCLFTGGTYSPGHKTVLENMWFLLVVILPQA